ncbi:MAG: TetR family transcriptional regulator [Acidimicrobiia bacterium]|nr:TetR family transcriptional regulator [Acidimicrobiia bacterium]
MVATPARRPQARGERTRTRILDAVLELVARDGPRAVTYRAVAATAGVANGVMTYHFPTHRELLAAAYAHHLAQLRDDALDLPIEALVDAPDDDKVALVQGFLRHMAVTDRLRYLAEFELALELARDPELRAQIEPASETTRQMAIDLLGRAGSSDPEADATLWSAAMEGLLLGWLARPDDARYQARADAAVDRMVRLLFAQPGPDSNT